MKPTEHPLQKALEARVRLLETTLQPSTVKQYRRTVRLFLGYLSQNFPEVHRPSQLRRDPHALGWLEYLWKLRTPTGSPLDSSTRGQHVLRLRTLLDLLADLPQPPRPGLLCGPDVPSGPGTAGRASGRSTICRFRPSNAASRRLLPRTPRLSRPPSMPFSDL